MFLIVNFKICNGFNTKMGHLRCVGIYMRWCNWYYHVSCYIFLFGSFLIWGRFFVLYRILWSKCYCRHLKAKLMFCIHSHAHTIDCILAPSFYIKPFANCIPCVWLLAGNGQPTHLYAEDAESSSGQSENLVAWCRSGTRNQCFSFKLQIRLCSRTFGNVFRFLKQKAFKYSCSSEALSGILFPLDTVYSLSKLCRTCSRWIWAGKIVVQKGNLVSVSGTRYVDRRNSKLHRLFPHLDAWQWMLCCYFMCRLGFLISDSKMAKGVRNVEP
jgi:hypothetical protein